MATAERIGAIQAVQNAPKAKPAAISSPRAMSSITPAHNANLPEIVQKTLLAWLASLCA